MDFLSLPFLIFLLITAVFNYIFPNKLRPIWLLAASFVFYYWGAKQFLPLMAVLCLITYLFGLLIQRFPKKITYTVGVFSILSSLLYFKYTNFFIDLLNRFLTLANHSEIQFIDVVAPLGISFMTFQAISYIGDIYYGKINAEKNLFIVALQVCFFPNVTSGPIQKAKHFIPQLKQPISFDPELIKNGLLLFSFGGLQKYFISDKLAPIVTNMQESLLTTPDHGGFHYLIFAFTYALYIYSNFNSYSDMAIGIAKVLGIRFSENFKRPYLSKSIKEFWQRWHISLNSWFVDYVYIPLGGSRNGKIKYYANIIVVFLLSGFWHGASLHFIVWGLLNAVYQIFGNLTFKMRQKAYDKLKIDQSSPFIVFWKRFCVFYLIAISWLFFAIPGTRTAARFSLSMMFPSLLSLFDGWFWGQFESISSAIALFAGILIFIFIQIKREKIHITQVLKKESFVIRYIIYAIIIFFLLFGYFGTFTGAGNGGFIYGDF